MSIVINIKDWLELPEYKFLKERDDIILLGMGGSYAYGLNTITSDKDVRGIIETPCNVLLGTLEYEQFVDDETDTTLYTLNKMIKLLISNNPNTIEICGLKPEHYIANDIGQRLVDNIDMFLSRKAIGSFKGYALAQLHRMENALCHDTYSEPQKLAHIKNAMERAMLSFNGRYESFKGQKLAIREDKSRLLLEGTINDCPVSEFYGMISELKEIQKNYDKLNNRNSKKDNYHLSKHIMHIFRLLYMYMDIAKDLKVITYREKEHDYLLQIKNGLFIKDDGSLRKEFYDAYSELEKEVDYVTKHTILPEQPDYAKIEDFLMSSNMATVLKQYNTTKKLLNRIIGEHKYE